MMYCTHSNGAKRPQTGALETVSQQPLSLHKFIIPSIRYSNRQPTNTRMVSSFYPDENKNGAPGSWAWASDHCPTYSASSASF